MNSYSSAKQNKKPIAALGVAVAISSLLLGVMPPATMAWADNFFGTSGPDNIDGTDDDDNIFGREGNDDLSEREETITLKEMKEMTKLMMGLEVTTYGLEKETMR